MKNLSVVILVGLLLGSFLLIGCAKAPQQDLDAAKAALEAAQAVEADRYAQDEMFAAKDSLDAAVAEIEKQNAKFALVRRYGKAKSLLLTTTNMANIAKDAAIANKEKVRLETESLIMETEAAIAATKELLKKAPRGKGEQMAVTAIKTDLEAVESSFVEAQTAKGQGDYLTARDKTAACLERAKALGEELKAAIEKKKGVTKM